MEDTKIKTIKIWLKGKYVYYNYDNFINVFLENNFFYNDFISIEAFLFKVFKIEKEDEERILSSFTLKKQEIELYLKDFKNHNKKDYMDILYCHLINMKFYLLNFQQKKEILELLQIPIYAYNCALEDFSKVQK